MRTGYIECFSGISGDMMLGALIDAGVPPELLQNAARSLGLGAELRFTRVDRSGISATKVDVLVNGTAAEFACAAAGQQTPDPADHEHSHSHAHPHALAEAHTDEPHTHEPESANHREEHVHPHEHDHTSDHAHTHAATHSAEHHHGRGLSQIRALIESAGLGKKPTAVALRTFELLAQSESKIHNVPVEQIHFHEVGAVDAIVDIVCSAVGLSSLGVDQWVCSALNVGGGFVECSHGKFPVPAPATADLLRGAPTYSSGVAMEMVTPTGAALIRALGCTFGDAPPMRVEKIGYGAGGRNPDRFPNVVRLSLGESTSDHPADKRGSFRSETIAVLECAVDDISSQVLAHCAQQALDAGALDVMSTPVVMKKGRLGTLITLLCRQERATEFEKLLFRETSTLGIRVRQEERVFLERKTVEVETRFGTVRVKVASSGGEQFHAQPEYEDCRQLAASAGVPLKQVIEAALLAYAGDGVKS